jgi:hypothetical protein
MLYSPLEFHRRFEGICYLHLLYRRVSQASWKHCRTLCRIEVLTAVVMKSSISWDITPWSPLKVNLRFWGTRSLHLEGLRISQGRNQREAGSKQFVDFQRTTRALLATCLTLVSCLTYSSTLKRRRHVPPERRLATNGLHGVISQKIELFIREHWF